MTTYISLYFLFSTLQLRRSVSRLAAGFLNTFSTPQNLPSYHSMVLELDASQHC